jgi:hypothetical protein
MTSLFDDIKAKSSSSSFAFFFIQSLSSFLVTGGPAIGDYTACTLLFLGMACTVDFGLSNMAFKELTELPASSFTA